MAVYGVGHQEGSARRGSHLLLAAVAIILAALGQPARAMLGVSPTLAPLDGPPGSRRPFTMKVTNGAKETLSCQMLTQHLALTEQGMPYGTAQPPARSAADWITFQPQRFTLAPGQTQGVKCTLAFPRDAAGGYYAIAAAYGQPPRGRDPKPGEAAIRLSFQANCVVMAVAKRGRLQPDLRVPRIELTRPEGSGAGTWRLRVSVENAGTVHGWAEGEAEVRDPAGGRAWSGPLKSGKGLVIPGFPRVFESTGPASLSDGQYIVGVSLHLRGQRAAVRAAQAFRVFHGEAVAVAEGGPLWAQTGALAVSTGEVILSGAPGARRVATVTVRNNTQERVEAQVTVAGWQVGKTGEGRPGPVDAAGSIARHLQVSPSSLSLLPNTTTRLRVTAEIPREGTGERYAVLLITPTAEGHATPVPVVVTLVAAGSEKPSLAIHQCGIRPAQGAGYSLWAKVHNDGNARVRPQVTFEVRDAKQTRVGDVIPARIEGGDLLPGVERAVAVDWPRALAPGKYTLVASASGPEGKAKVSNTSPFTVPLAKGPK